MKKIILMCILACSSLAGLSPERKELYIEKAFGINPYENIWRAVCLVESGNDPKAYNPKENAVGISQIRQIRINDYNKRTGKSYKLKDMYDPDKSKEVFLYYAVKIGEDNPEKIIKSWNGSGKQTYQYLAKVKKHLR